MSFANLSKNDTQQTFFSSIDVPHILDSIASIHAPPTPSHAFDSGSTILKTQALWFQTKPNFKFSCENTIQRTNNKKNRFTSRENIILYICPKTEDYRI